MDNKTMDERFELRTVSPDYDGVYLYCLLKERNISTESISHREIPKWNDHIRFVESHPYRLWCLIWNKSTLPPIQVGMTYLSHKNEIGVQVEKAWQGTGIGKWAVRRMMEHYGHIDRFYANINPLNERSIHLFRSLGFFDCQLTLQWKREEHGPVVFNPEGGLHERTGGDAPKTEGKSGES
jgi:RimJ/RimL family protein N-acetyltransferase